MRNAYKILGLSPDASEAEIKKAYRTLAKIHHPDISDGDPSKFLEISQAYEYLLNPNVQFKTGNGNSSTQEKEAEKAARFERAKRQFKEQQYKEFVEQERYFNKLTRGIRRKIFNSILYVSVLLNIVLLVDFIIPGNWETPATLEVMKTSEFGGISHKRLKHARVNGEGVFVPLRQMRYLYQSGYMNIEKSKILGLKKRIAVKKDAQYLIMSPGFSYSSTYPLIIFLLSIPVITRLLMKQKSLIFLFLYRLSLFGTPSTWLAMLLFYI